MDEILKIKSRHELRAILDSLLAEDERKMILRRLAIMALIKQGAAYREIGKILWVSPATISAIKKNLFIKGPHKSHRLVYKNKEDFSSLTNNSMLSFPDNFLTAISFVIEGLIKAFSTKGLGVTGDQKNEKQKRKF